MTDDDKPLRLRDVLPPHNLTFTEFRKGCEMVGCLHDAVFVGKVTRFLPGGYPETVAEMRLCPEHRGVWERRYSDVAE